MCWRRRDGAGDAPVDGAEQGAQAALGAGGRGRGHRSPRRRPPPPPPSLPAEMPEGRGRAHASVGSSTKRVGGRGGSSRPPAGGWRLMRGTAVTPPGAGTGHAFTRSAGKPNSMRRPRRLPAALRRLPSHPAPRPPLRLEEEMVGRGEMLDINGKF